MAYGNQERSIQSQQQQNMCICSCQCSVHHSCAETANARQRIWRPLDKQKGFVCQRTSLTFWRKTETNGSYSHLLAVQSSAGPLQTVIAGRRVRDFAETAKTGISEKNWCDKVSWCLSWSQINPYRRCVSGCQLSNHRSDSRAKAALAATHS